MASNKEHKKRKEINASHRLFSNKKGLLGDVGTAIGNIIGTIFHTIPKPLLFLIFLAILLLLGQLLTYVFNIAGIYCNSADVPVKTGFNLLTTVELIGAVPDKNEIGKDDVALNTVLGLNNEKGTDCSIYLTSGTITYTNGTTQNFTNRWFYDGTYCSQCTEIKILDYTGRSFMQMNVKPEDGICLGDAYRLPDSSKGWWKQWNCKCEPPIHYKYSYQTNTYQCIDANGCTQITIGQKWDDTLKSKGATVLYGDLNENTNPQYTGMIGITCRDLHPRLAIWHIDIFDFRLWVVLMLLTILFWAFKAIHL
jgi:hypothetical protein